MTEHRVTDETALIVLNDLVRDMRHLLEWVAIGLGCLAFTSLVRLVGSLADRAWLWVGWDVGATLVFAASAIETTRRAAKYRPGVKR